MATPKPTHEQLEAARGFQKRWSASRCKREGYSDWRDALSSAWSAGWDDQEPDGHLLRQLRNNFGPQWLRAQAT